MPAPLAFKDVNSGGGYKPGGALAFNEAQLMNELTGLKKGGALGTLAATVIPALIQMAPQIISSLKSLISGKEGGALKFGGASAHSNSEELLLCSSMESTLAIMTTC